MHTIPWHLVTAAQRILARISPTDLIVVEHNGAIPGDRFHLEGDAVDQLAKVRRDFIARKLGGTFLELEAAGRLDDWRRADAEHAHVQTVLAERFGTPMAFAGYSRDEAEQRWRIAAQARTSSELAA